MTEQRACPVAGGKILRLFFRNMYFIPSILIPPGGDVRPIAAAEIGIDYDAMASSNSL
jgi:hypothetical protein